MTRVLSGLCSAGLFWACALHAPRTIAEEPDLPPVNSTSPDPFESAPGAATPKDVAKPLVAAADSKLHAPVIAVLDMRQVFAQSRYYQGRLNVLRIKAGEPSAERKKLESELQEVKLLLHDFALHPSGQFDIGLSLSPGIRRTEVPFEAALERVAVSDLPVAQRFIKKYRLKQHELDGLREAEQLEQKAQLAALEREYLLKIRVVVRKIAEANTITHVFNQCDALDQLDGLQATLASPIVYTRPEFNITNLVVNGLNKEIDVEPIKDSDKRHAELEPRPGPSIPKPVKPTKE